MEFTKGPWRLSRYHWPYAEIVVGDGNDSMAKSEGRLICQNESLGKSKDEYRANAHLIAAAPEMYKALDRTLIALLECDFDVYFPDEVKQMQAALAKARGEVE